MKKTLFGALNIVSLVLMITMVGCQDKVEQEDNSGSYYGYDFVDLGLPSGTMWASYNVGATKPEECGNYYAWGETQPKSIYSMSTYSYNNHIERLQLSDDPANVVWGGDWRMPTKEEFDELKTKCRFSKKSGGYEITGPNGNSIFMPAGGVLCDNEKVEEGSGRYWSSTLGWDGPDRAWDLFLGSGTFTTKYGHRYNGRNVRPVFRFMLSLSSPSVDFYEAATSESRLTILSNTTWTATCSEDWVTIDKTTNSDCSPILLSDTSMIKRNVHILLKASDNTTTADREATITISAKGLEPKTITVRQVAMSNDLSLSAQSLKYEAEGGTNTISLVTTNPSWTVSSPDKWVTVTSSTNSNSGTITVVAEENKSTEQRTATVVIKGSMENNEADENKTIERKITVTQAGMPKKK